MVKILELFIGKRTKNVEVISADCGYCYPLVNVITLNRIYQSLILNHRIQQIYQSRIKNCVHLVRVGHVELSGGPAVAEVADSNHLLDQLLRLLEGQVLGAALGLQVVAELKKTNLKSIMSS